jgi:RNA polymerase sigma factor (sigma-70 family)
MSVASREFEFAEVLVGKLLLETFANEQSAYHSSEEISKTRDLLSRHGRKLKYHISRSLSERQRQVIKHYLMGLKEREIAAKLGITQQVVNIYKQRAIKKLARIMTA